MAARKKTLPKKTTTKTGADSAAVASKPLPLVGLKKKSDNSTSYNKTNAYHKQPVPDQPYGGVPRKKPTGKK